MLSDHELRRLVQQLPAPLLEATVLDPPLDANGWMRVEIDNRPGQAEVCPWQPGDHDPAPGDAASVIESDVGNFWVLAWWSQSGNPRKQQGSVWHTGSGAPAAGLGAVGDFYLDGDNGDFYEKTADDTWTFRGNLRGPGGDQAAARVPFGTPAASWVIPYTSDVPPNVLAVDSAGQQLLGNVVVDEGAKTITITHGGATSGVAYLT